MHIILPFLQMGKGIIKLATGIVQQEYAGVKK
jgi:hypothetical protein